MKGNTTAESFGNNNNILLSTHKALFFAKVKNFQWNISLGT